MVYILGGGRAVRLGMWCPRYMLACRVAPLALEHRDVNYDAARSTARVRGVTGGAGGRCI
jgi:hypothetical protein